MRTLLFAPITMNLAEVTRMIEVARAATGFRAVFMGYEDDWAHLITDAGFDYRPCQPAWTEREKRLALALDQGRTLRSPFSAGLVERRVRLERDLIAQTQAAAVVTGTNLTSFISARAEGVPLFYPVPFALTVPHVRQIRNEAQSTVLSTCCVVYKVLGQGKSDAPVGRHEPVHRTTIDFASFKDGCVFDPHANRAEVDRLFTDGDAKGDVDCE